MLIIIILLIIIVIVWRNNVNANVNANANNDYIEGMSQGNGLPVRFDPKTGSVITSPDFIPQYIQPAWGTPLNNDNGNGSKYGQIDLATDLGTDTLAFNLCSKSCCSDQYPVPFALPIDPQVCANKNKFVPSSYTCNNEWNDTGCLCMTKKQGNLISNRGNNV